MKKKYYQKLNTNKKSKTKGTILIPGGLKDVLMGSSKETNKEKIK